MPMPHKVRISPLLAFVMIGSSKFLLVAGTQPGENEGNPAPGQAQAAAAQNSWPTIALTKSQRVDGIQAEG
jgi:hypothetical protein